MMVGSDVLETPFQKPFLLGFLSLFVSVSKVFFAWLPCVLCAVSGVLFWICFKTL